MRIGIVTFCKAVNYGAYLQAYCLGEFIKQQGHDVYYISKFSLKETYWRIHNLYSYHLDRIKFRNKFRKNFILAQKKLNIVRESCEFDLVIIGSDEMWQLRGDTIKPLPLYWGEGMAASKIITYAVCSNGTNAQDVEEFSFIKKGLKKISAFSVRDEMTRKVYQPFISGKIAVHLDPTFLIDLKKYLVLPDISNYILVYTYSFNLAQIDVAKALSKKTGLPLVAAGNKFSWCDISLPASPFEFLGLIHKARYVITDTFHGTVLSVNLQKDFFVFTDKKEKIKQFIKEFLLEDRAISNVKTLERALQKPLDYEKVNKEIYIIKKKSEIYLRTFL